MNCFQPFRPCPALRPCPARPGPFALVLLMMQPASITTCLQCQSRRAALSLRSASSSSSSSNQRRHSGRHRTGATAGQAAQARGAAGPGRRQPASARGDDTTASPGRRLSVRTVIVRTTAAASAVARGTPSRTFPRARAGNNMHAHNLNATARFHCFHPTRRVALAYSWNNVMDQLQGGQPRIMIGARACGDRVCIWMVVTIGRLLAHVCVMATVL